MSASENVRRFTPPPVAREPDGSVLGGVAAGLGHALGVDPTFVRLIFALLTFAGGSGIALYVGGWLLLPVRGAPPPTPRRLAFGVGALIAGGSLALSGLGLADSLVWPVALIGAGIFLLRGRTVFGITVPPVTGLVLTAIGFIVFLQQNGSGSGGIGPLLAPGTVVVGLLMVVGPWLWRLAGERDAERAARIRTEEREELAARVHDSVLQTLALIQREDDPRRIAALARRQERELRGWLYPDVGRVEGESLAGTIETFAAEIEEVHGIRVEFVHAGDCPLDERTRALTLAAREAMGNAARHAGVSELSVFVDVTADSVSVFVRDRGKGFDPGSIPSDRRGIAESIRARMERAGGEAIITTTPGEGAEVELRLARAAP